MAEVDGVTLYVVWGRNVCRLELGVRLSMLPRTLSASPAAESSWLKSCVASTTSSTLRPIDCVSTSNCCNSSVSRCNNSAMCADRSDASAADSSSIYDQHITPSLTDSSSTIFTAVIHVWIVINLSTLVVLFTDSFYKNIIADKWHRASTGRTPFLSTDQQHQDTQ